VPLIRLEKRDLPIIIENIERNGGDASDLRALLDGAPGSHSLKAAISEVSDDELVEMIRKDSTVEEGEGLICSICPETCSRLTNGVCDSCFQAWAISCKKGYLAKKRQDLAEV